MLMVQDRTLSLLFLLPCLLLAATSLIRHGPLSFQNHKPNIVFYHNSRKATNTPPYLHSTWESACVPVPTCVWPMQVDPCAGNYVLSVYDPYILSSPQSLYNPPFPGSGAWTSHPFILSHWVKIGTYNRCLTTTCSWWADHNHTVIMTITCGCFFLMKEECLRLQAKGRGVTVLLKPQKES